MHRQASLVLNKSDNYDKENPKYPTEFESHHRGFDIRGKELNEDFKFMLREVDHKQEELKRNIASSEKYRTVRKRHKRAKTTH